MTTFAGKYSEDLQDRYGNGFKNASVAVQTLEDAAATLYADRIKTAYIPADGLEGNEIKADSKGNLIFFADPGNYQIVVTPVGGSALPAYPVTVYKDPLEPGDIANVKEFGAIGDGTAHPLSERYASLAAAQVVYPHAVALTDQIDWAAIQGAINSLPATGGKVLFPEGRFLVNQTVKTLIPSTWLQGVSGGAHRDSANRGATQILGITADMTVYKCAGTDGAGETIMQGGPVVENISFVDKLGADADDFGTMTLVEMRAVNRWEFRNCHFAYGDIGMSLQKISETGVSKDIAQWTIWKSPFSYCRVGLVANCLTGTVDTCWFTSCPTGILSEDQDPAQGGAALAVGSIVVRGCKFDIREPLDQGAEWEPAIGIHVKSSTGIRIVDCTAESQPTDIFTFTTRFIVIEGATSGTRVIVRGGQARNINIGIDALTCRVLRVSDFIARNQSGSVDTDAAIRIYQVLDVVIVAAKSDIQSPPPIQLQTYSNNRKTNIMGYYDTVEVINSSEVVSKTVSALPWQTWVGDTLTSAISSAGTSTVTVQEIGEGGPQSLAGTGSPEGVISAPLGSEYRNKSGGAGQTLWIKETAPTGSTGWVAK